MVKSYNLTIDYVLYEMSYTNMVMYGAVLPTYGVAGDKKEKTGEPINADDPKNRQIVRNILFNG